MSAELIAIIAVAVTTLTATLGGLAWVVSRIDRVEARLGDRIDGVERELTEVKIALARIEGPRPRFVTR